MVTNAWIIVVVCVVSALADDLTLEERATGAEVVEAAISILDETCVFTDNRQLLRRIAKLETDDGNDDDTFVVNGQDYYGGIWRVSEPMFTLAKSRVDLYVSVLNAYGIDLSKVVYQDLTKPLYSALIARIWIDSSPPSNFAVENYDIPWSDRDQADYWADTYHHFTTTATYQDYLAIIDDLDDVCTIPRADIVFVLDGSGSIGENNFQTMLGFVVEVVDAFDVSKDGVRIGVIKYSGSSATEFYLGQITGKLEVTTEVQRIVYEKGGTNTAAALDDLREMFEEYGRGNGVPQIGIVITDGQSNDEAATEAAAQKVHDEKLTVFAVGVTSGVNVGELNTIGTDPDCIHVHLLQSFTDISPFTSTIQSQACRAPAELEPGTDVDGSVVTGQRVFFKLKLKRRFNGATIKLKIRSGGGRLFVSFKARNPGRAVFKYQLRVDSSNLDGGKMYIQFPTDVDEALDTVETFVALMGEGFGAPNLYTIGTNDGGLSAGSEVKPMMLVLLLGMLLALM